MDLIEWLHLGGAAVRALICPDDRQLCAFFSRLLPIFRLSARERCNSTKIVKFRNFAIAEQNQCVYG
jgi:hypothetical protein